MTTYQANQTPEYLQKLKAAGINVPAYEARRFHVLLLRLDTMKAYVQRKLDESGDQWLMSLIKGGEAYLKRKNADYSDVEIVQEARQSLLDVLEIPSNGSIDPEAVSKWLLEWLSEDGLSKLRSAVNGQIASKRRKRSPISCYTETRDRFNQAQKQNGWPSGDAFLNHLLDLYEAG